MNTKRTLALILTVVMLVSAFPMSVFATSQTAAASNESVAYDSQDYYFKFDFDDLTASGTKTNVFTGGLPRTDGVENPKNPYGFTFYSCNGNVKGYVKERGDGGNYAAVEYDTPASSWLGVQMTVGKEGMPASVFNTVSFETDFRWQGLAEAAAYSSTKDFNLLTIRRTTYGYDIPIIKARVNDDGSLSLYLKYYGSGDTNLICTLQAGERDFTNIKVVYYDVTQTISLYINKQIVAEGLSLSDTIDFRTDTYVVSEFEQADFFNTSRDNKSGDYLVFEFARTAFNASGVGLPLKYDIDNLFVKNEDIAEGITAYYENGFNGVKTNFIGVADKVSGKTYQFQNDSSSIGTRTGTGDYAGDTYLNVAGGGCFTIRDVYQFMQDGNFVIEFDARATATADNTRFLSYNTGVDVQNVLTVSTDGSIKLMGQATGAKIKPRKNGNDFNEGEWTNIALSVMVDKGNDNKGVMPNFTSYNSNGLSGGNIRIQFALFVDGKLVALYSDWQRYEYIVSGTTVKTIDGKQYTKSALTANLTEDVLATVKSTVESNGFKYYYTENGDIYQVAYNSDASFASGVYLKFTGYYYDDIIRFFNNSGYTISGALDNLKIYSGVVPLNWASTPNATTGVVAEIDFTKLSLSNLNDATMNQKGGDVGVALLNQWRSNNVKLTTGENGAVEYGSVTFDNTWMDRYLSVYTQNMGGKMFSVEATVRNVINTAKKISLFTLRRQDESGSASASILNVTADGRLEIPSVVSNAYCRYLCDENGNDYYVNDGEWKRIQVIVDETGADSRACTYLVNGKVAYSYRYSVENATPAKAIAVTGVYSSTVRGLSNAVDQRLQLLTGGQTSGLTIKYDIKSLKAEYAVLPEEAQQINGFYEADANVLAGGLYSAKVSLANFNRNYDVKLLELKRAATINTPVYSFETLFAEADTGYFFFEHDNGHKYYLVNEQRARYSAAGATAVTPEVIFDERGEKLLVTFLVDGAVAYYDNGEELLPARNLYIGGDVVHALKDGAIQKMRFYGKDGATEFPCVVIGTTVLTAVGTVPEAEKIVWADSLRADFSEYENISELLAAYGGQLEVEGDVTLTNGVLNIPANGSLKWIDYNGTLTSYIAYDRNAVNGNYVNGYTIEFVGNTDATEKARGLVQLSRADEKNNELNMQPLVYVKSGSLHLTGNKTQNYKLNDVGSDRFNSFAVSFAGAYDVANVFADGYLLGISKTQFFNVADEYADYKVVKICITGETELKELRIHRDLEREIAQDTGEIFKLDADKMNINNNGSGYSLPCNGVMTTEIFDNAMTVETYVDEATDQSFKYFRIQPSGEQTTQLRTDIWLNGYLEDKVTVFEYEFRFDPVEGGKSVGMCAIRRSDSNVGVFESLFSLTSESNYSIHNGYILCDKDGKPLVASAENWNQLAIIYDADAGLVSYVLNGRIPYFKDGSEIKYAHEIQLSYSRNYRMDADETRLVTLQYNAGSANRVDLAKLNVYTVDGTANAGFVGTQVDTSHSNIRLIAGVDMMYYGRVGFEIEAFDKNGVSLTDVAKSYNTQVIYSAVMEVVDGVEQYVYPEDYGYRYFYTANIMGVSRNEAIRLHVTPYTVVNGVKYVADTTVLDVDFTSGATDERTLVIPSVEIKPEGDNVNANFSTTDIVAYTNDGALEFNGLDAKFGFAAELDGGVVSVNLTNAFGEVAERTVLDIYVDGVLTQEALALPFGHHTVVLAKNLTGSHEFVIVKRSGGDFICINSMSVCGSLVTPPALAGQGVVEVVVEAPKSGAEYGDVFIYVPTTDESGDYFVKYNLKYVDEGVSERFLDTNASNDPNYNDFTENNSNCRMYRVNGADLCKKNGNSYAIQFGLLQTGEISVAIRESVGGVNAADFSGGYHGDENFISLKLLADGEEIDTAKAGTYTGITAVEFLQDSIIDRCNEPDTPILYHNQHFLIDTNGLRIDRRLEILADDFTPHINPNHQDGMLSFTMMGTVYRIQNVGEKVLNINTLKLLNANGEVMSKYDMTADEFSSTNTHSNVVCGNDTKTENRYAVNTGDKGVYARVGFVIDDASMEPKSVDVDVRRMHGDNKWYAVVGSYQTKNDGDVVPKGEVWNMSTYYFVDYNSANVGVQGADVKFGDVIIFGDSYSTYEGYIPEGYSSWYTSARNNGVLSVSDTWWHSLISETGSKLVQNNSWSGSTIGYTGYDGADTSTTSSFIYRLEKLLDEGFFDEKPVDTVFVLGGTNDDWANAPLGELKFDNFEESDLYSVLPAIGYFSKLLNDNLPNAKKVFIINTGLDPAIAGALSRASEHFGFDVVVLENIDKENGHPTKQGMDDIKNQILTVLGE